MQSTAPFASVVVQMRVHRVEYSECSIRYGIRNTNEISNNWLTAALMGFQAKTDSLILCVVAAVVVIVD